MNEKQKKDAINRSWANTNPIVSAALTINQIHQQFLDVSAVANELCDSFSKIKKGNLVDVEAMLWAQAQTLNVFFHRCLSEAVDCEFMPQIQTFSDLALRAQNNCRKTLATLAEIKNPKRATFVKQQNNAINQQVNNNSENLEKPTNEVLNEEAHAQLDDRRTQASITINSSLETLEKISRGENTDRKSCQ